MLRGMHHSFRLLRIALVLGPALRGPRLAQAFERLGPSFIKLGQTLSTRADLIGPVLAARLASLRDDIPPFSTHAAKKIIRQELGRPLPELFAQFPDAPVAAASIAQVYKAVRADGASVAVKVVRPGVAKRFARDIALFYWCARMAERFFPATRRLRPSEIVQTLERSVAFELDLRYEAAAIDEMAENIRADTGWRVPQPDWNLTAGRVLTTQWLEGTPIHHVEALRATGHDVNAILARLSEHFFKHVFRDGFFHADLHPGNVFVDADGNIAVVDFGIMGRLDWRQRLYVAEIFRGFLNEDFRHVAEVHFKAGYVPPEESMEDFAQACRAIAKPILGRPVQEISLAGLLGQLFAVTKTFRMETQPQLLMLQKTMVVVEGVGRMLNPQVNMWEMARAPIEQWAAEHFGPAGRLKHALWSGKDTAEKFPETLQRLHAALARFADPAGIRLHPATTARLVSEERGFRRQVTALWLLTLCLAAAGYFLMQQ